MYISPASAKQLTRSMVNELCITNRTQKILDSCL